MDGWAGKEVNSGYDYAVTHSGERPILAWFLVTELRYEDIWIV